MRTVKHVNLLKPSVEYVERQGRLLVDGEQMATFLGVERKTVQQLVYTDRIPLPVSLGLGKCLRWSVIELLEWVEAGCPGRGVWIAARGRAAGIRNGKLNLGDASTSAQSYVTNALAVGLDR